MLIASCFGQVDIVRVKLRTYKDNEQYLVSVFLTYIALFFSRLIEGSGLGS